MSVDQFNKVANNLRNNFSNNKCVEHKYSDIQSALLQQKHMQKVYGYKPKIMKFRKNNIIFYIVIEPKNLVKTK